MTFCKEIGVTKTPEFILGTWFIGDIGCVPDEDGILVMLAGGRAIQFPSSITRPQSNLIHRLWFSCPDANSIRFRGRPDVDGWIRYIERTATGWSMISNNHGERRIFPCRLARTEDLPEWHTEMLESHLAKMDALEQNKEAEQVGDGDAEEAV